MTPIGIIPVRAAFMWKLLESSFWKIFENKVLNSPKVETNFAVVSLYNFNSE